MVKKKSSVLNVKEMHVFGVEEPKKAFLWLGPAAGVCVCVVYSRDARLCKTEEEKLKKNLKMKKKRIFLFRG